jgi:hypothetical protein
MVTTEEVLVEHLLDRTDLLATITGLAILKMWTGTCSVAFARGT